MRKINILGIRLKDYTLRESLKKVDEYMKNGALHTIAYISSQMLVTADENAAQKEWIESMDMTICAEVDILYTEEGVSKNRVREIEENAFMTELLRKIAREKRKIYLIAETKEQLVTLQRELLEMQNNLQVVGCAVLSPEDNVDNFINEVNDLVPNVIFSRISSPRQEQLIYENKKKINAGIWVALLEGNVVHNRRQKARKQLIRYVYKKLFHKKVADYRSREEE